MSDTMCCRYLDIFTHGECNSNSSQAAIATHTFDTTYQDCDVCELVPAVHKPFTNTAAGYWAIIRALKEAPFRSHLAIMCADELCVATINLFLLGGQRMTGPCGGTYRPSHEPLVKRIIEDVKSRRAAGCIVAFEYTRESDVYGERIVKVRRLAQKALKEAAAKGSAYETLASSFDKLSHTNTSTSSK